MSITASGDGLREIMENQPVDLILLDINLPDENGLMLTRALRERSTVGIILVTGRSDPIDRIVGLEMGADDYVIKPLELRELVVRVKICSGVSIWPAVPTLSLRITAIVLRDIV